ncbi:MAG: isoprenyl transferase [Rhodothermaceae bacterium]
MPKKFETEIESVIEKKNVPEHIAIIMDGNGRWAKKRALPRAAGHKKGVNTVREIVEICAEIGVKYLTLYTFSTENWNRPKDEVSTLMQLIIKSLKSETKKLHENNIRLCTIGDKNLLPEKVNNELSEAMGLTKNNSRLQLNLALSYSGRWDIVNAARQLAQKVKNGEIEPGQINNDLFQNFLSTSEMPDPDLMIRTGGDLRISNFLLWQLAYSEIFVTEKLWPDFSKKDLISSISNFQNRERRFGLTSEQI